MQTPRLNAIQNLIGQSVILNPQERAEWLGLLDLMTDRQLMELERILIDATRAQAEQEAKKTLPQAAAAPKTSALSASNPAQQQGSFSHILNFPAGSPDEPKSKTPEPKKDSPFQAKLKSIISERELPAAPLPELSGPLKQKAEVKKSVPPVVPVRPKPLAPQQPVTPSVSKHAAKPENVTINVFVNSKEDEARVPGLIKAETVLREVMPEASIKFPEKTPAADVPPASKPQPAPTEFKTPGSPAAAARPPVQQPAPSKQPEGVPLTSFFKPKNTDFQQPVPKNSSQPNLVNPGLNFTPGLVRGEPLKTALTREPSGVSRNKPEPAPGISSSRIVLDERPGDDINLDTLAQLGMLTPADFQKHATGTFFRKLQKLVAIHGQHEVTFNLEKSPLYKTYVSTGIDWLKNEGGKSTAAGMLPRGDFERFADLLIIMRSRG